MNTPLNKHTTPPIAAINMYTGRTELFIDTNNPYFKIEIDDDGQAIHGMPCSELSNPTAIKSRISDLESDLKELLTADIPIDDIAGALEFLKQALI